MSMASSAEGESSEARLSVSLFSSLLRLRRFLLLLLGLLLAVGPGVEDLCAGLRWLMRWWGGREGFFCVPDWARGSALPARERGWAPLFGVPGPREDWRREDDVGGMARWLFRRRRLEGSVDGERAAVRDVEGFARAEVAVMGAAVVRGEGWRVGWTRRLRGLLAMVVEGPALPERG